MKFSSDVYISSLSNGGEFEPASHSLVFRGRISQFQKSWEEKMIFGDFEKLRVNLSPGSWVPGCVDRPPCKFHI